MYVDLPSHAYLMDAISLTEQQLGLLPIAAMGERTQERTDCEVVWLQRRHKQRGK